MSILALKPLLNLSVEPSNCEVFTLPTIFYMDSNMKWVDSNIIPFFGWQPSHFSIPCPLWNPYETPMEWCLPYAIRDCKAVCIYPGASSSSGAGGIGGIGSLL